MHVADGTLKKSTYALDLSASATPCRRLSCHQPSDSLYIYKVNKEAKLTGGAVYEKYVEEFVINDRKIKKMKSEKEQSEKYRIQFGGYTSSISDIKKGHR
jgi:hypothetical protein